MRNVNMCYDFSSGVLAHLVERFYGIEEVTSSNLVHSTINLMVDF